MLEKKAEEARIAKEKAEAEIAKAKADAAEQVRAKDEQARAQANAVCVCVCPYTVSRFDLALFLYYVRLIPARGTAAKLPQGSETKIRDGEGSRCQSCQGAGRTR